MTQTTISGAPAVDFTGKVIEYIAYGAGAKGKRDGRYEILKMSGISSTHFLVLGQNINTKLYVVFEADLYSFNTAPTLVYPSYLIKSPEFAEQNYNNRLNKINRLKTPMDEVRNIDRLPAVV
ncbi:MAG: hypothetical protein LBU81_01850 [Methanosarcinales archaeon]|nr:hypothetical protein [Methanosarcinales archaeon]